MDPVTFLCWAAIATGILFIFLLSMAEASLLAISDVTVRRLVDEGNTRARMIMRLRDGHEYLSAIIVGVNSCVILVSTVMTVLLHHNVKNISHWHEELWHIGTVAVILVFAEITPKTWGALSSERIALWIVPMIRTLDILTAPVIRGITRISNFLLGIRNGMELHTRSFVTAREIKAAVDISQEEGSVEPDEGEMLDSVIELGETTAREILVPRVNIFAVPETASAAEAIDVVVTSGHSRIPIYRNTIDRIVGILYVTDLLRAFEEGRREINLMEIARAPVFVPETKRVDELFRELRDQSVHMAVVLDEFGGTEGLVTIEDILEELVGDIADEHDAPDDDIMRIDEHSALVIGQIRLSDINEDLDLHLPEDEYETLSGLVAGLMGHIPQVGESCEFDNLTITVHEGTEQHADRFRIDGLPEVSEQ